MALWMVRAGRHGEHEPRFFGDNKVYLTWKELGEDLHDLNDRAAIRKRLAEHFPAATPAKLSNNTGQIAAFLLEMKPDDLVRHPAQGQVCDGDRQNRRAPCLWRDGRDSVQAFQRRAVAQSRRAAIGV